MNHLYCDHPNLNLRYNAIAGNANTIGPSPQTQGCWVKMISPFLYCQTNSLNPAIGAWSFTNLLNHELGHVFGLAHTWNDNDGCTDTPLNWGCWDSGSGTCADVTPPPVTWSNNTMDYNNSNQALTPCQITRIHNTLGGVQTSLVAACGTCAPTVAQFGLESGGVAVTTQYLPSSGSLMMQGGASSGESSFQVTLYRVAAPGCYPRVGGVYYAQTYNSSFDAMPTATNYLAELNLSSLYSFSTNAVYRLRLRTFSNCGGAPDSMITYFHTYATPSQVPTTCDGSRPAPGPNPGSSSLGYRLPLLETHPNPAGTTVTVRY